MKIITSNYLKKKYGELAIQVLEHNDYYRDVVISTVSGINLIYAITLAPNLDISGIKKIWEEIKDMKFLGETLLKYNFELRKKNIIKLKSYCPKNIMEIVGSKTNFYDSFVYDLFIIKGRSFFFSKVIEVLLLNDPTENLNYNFIEQDYLLNLTNIKNIKTEMEFYNNLKN